MDRANLLVIEDDQLQRKLIKENLEREGFTVYDTESGKQALEAIGQAPNWLQEDLTDKFVELGAIPFSLGEIANAAFNDMDNDGDLDLICCTQSDGLMYYENCGTVYEPMYVLDASIFKNIDIVGETIREPSVGDINNDGKVGFLDLFSLLKAVLTDSHNWNADLNLDLEMSSKDLGVWWDIFTSGD